MILYLVGILNLDTRYLVSEGDVKNTLISSIPSLLVAVLSFPWVYF